MKKIILSIATILILGASALAQSPESFKYQAVVRDASSAIINTQAVGMQFTILQGSATGTAVYTESFLTTTNAYGLVDIEIGTGTSTDDFSVIDWGNGPYFIETAVDLAGGTTYTVMGTSQLLSVPYAIHANTADSITGPINETDPAFTAWDKSTGITITESQISDLTHTVDTDTQLDSTDIANLGYVAPLGFSPYTITDSIVISGPGTYIINYGDYAGIGIVSCYIDQVPNGIWNAGGTIAFSEAPNTQDFLFNVVEYQLYSGGAIDAELRALNGVNYDNIGTNINGRVEVVVTAISQPSVLRWSVTIFQ